MLVSINSICSSLLQATPPPVVLVLPALPPNTPPVAESLPHHLPRPFSMMLRGARPPSPQPSTSPHVTHLASLTPVHTLPLTPLQLSTRAKGPTSKQSSRPSRTVLLKLQQKTLRECCLALRRSRLVRLPPALLLLHPETRTYCRQAAILGPHITDTWRVGASLSPY